MRSRQVLIVLPLLLLPLGRVAAQQRDTIGAATRADSARPLKPLRPQRTPFTTLTTVLGSRRDSSASRDTIRWDPRAVRSNPGSRSDDFLAGLRAGAGCSRLDLWCTNLLEDAYRSAERRPGLGYLLGTLLGQGLTSERARQLRLLGDTSVTRRP